MKLPKFAGLVAGMLAGTLLCSPAMLNAAVNPPEAAAPAQLSPSAQEVLKLFKAGVSEEVLLGFIGNTTNAFNLDADDLIALHQQGVPSGITTAMLQQDLDNNRARQQNLAAAPIPGSSQAATNAAIPLIQEGAPAVEQFYSALAPYGTWFQLPEWGWAWQPKEATLDPEWRPYVDGGRWVWTDHGWYWASDYPWGWAGFHYGRWLKTDKIGWVWIPDTVWAPSWVTWRHTDEHVGWAPLPPDALKEVQTTDEPIISDYDFGLPQETYTFVVTRYIFVDNVRSYCLPPWKAKDIYRRCKVVNHYTPGKHRGWVNRGLPIDRISNATGRRLPPLPAYGKGGHGRHHNPNPGVITPAPQHPSSPVPAAGHQFNLGQSPTLKPAPRLPASPGNQRNPPALPATTPKNPGLAPMNPGLAPMNPSVKPISPAPPISIQPEKAVVKPPFSPAIPAAPPANVPQRPHNRPHQQPHDRQDRPQNRPHDWRENRRIDAHHRNTTAPAAAIQPAPAWKAAQAGNPGLAPGENWNQRRKRN